MKNGIYSPTMYVRRTTTQKNQYTFRLVRAERRGQKVSQRTLLNLGAHFDLERTHWPQLCRRIQEILNGQLSLLEPVPRDLESHAQRIAAQLLAKGRIGCVERVCENREPNLQMYDADSVRMIRPRSVGVENVALWAMDQMRLRQLFEELGLSASLCDAAVGSIVARMAKPASELATHRWLAERSALGELIGRDFETLSLMQLYRASDALMANRQAIEHHLFEQAMRLFDLQPTVALYDLTNTYFEGIVDGIDKATHGHSKERRSDCRLLTVGLVLDGSGFVRRFQVFSGNVREHHTLAQMLERLQAPADALVVMDRGVATEDRVAWLRGQGWRYVVASRELNRQFDPEQAVCHETRSGRQVQLQKEVSADGQEVRLYCFSAARAAKEQALSERFATRFEKALDELSQGLSRPRTVKRVERIQQRIGRLQEQARGVARHYRVTVRTDASGRRATAVHFTRLPVEGTMLTHPGVYALRSSETDWDETTLWQTYFRLSDIEAVFRSLKSELGLRPIFHRKSIRAEGHLFITVMAYQLVQVIRSRLRQSGDHSSWNTLRDVLDGQRRTTAVFRRGDGRTLHVRRATDAEPAQQAILEVLGADEAPGGTRKTVV